MDTKTTLKQLIEATGVSGYEQAVREVIVQALTPLTDSIKVDALGNVIALKRGEGNDLSSPGSPLCCGKVMLAGHMDEIGLMVTKLDNGFIRFTPVGGFDRRVLPSQEITIHGRRSLLGVVASRPPHVLSAEERKKPLALDKLFIDVGLPEDELAQVVEVGDLISIRREMLELRNGFVAGKAMDDRASVAAIIVALDHLQSIRHTWDVFAVATVQEEVGLKGAFTSTYGLNPDIGIALDVTFAKQPGVGEDEGVDLDKGPAIAFGPNIHPRLFDRLVEVAKERELPHQIEPIPGPTGTDAWAIQVTRAGIPTALLSIPLRNMHTSVEMLSIKDIERAGRLLALFISELDDEFLNALRLE